MFRTALTLWLAVSFLALSAASHRVLGQGTPAVAPQTFDQWSAQLPDGKKGPSDDADGDGLANLVEYAFGLNPLQAGQDGLPAISFANGVITYSFTRPSSVVGVEYFVRASKELNGFSEALPLSKTSETETTETWAASIPASGATEFAWSSLVKLAAPVLTGHSGGSRPEELNLILPYDIQAAFNNDTFFWHVSYPGNEGKRHDYIRYTNGSWQKDGGDRRDAQASIDGDAKQGSTSTHSSIYEQRTSIMISDPSSLSRVTNFEKFGCFLACHNQSRHMPEWTAAAGEDTKFIDLAEVFDKAVGSDKVLDLWHWRGARSNPIWRADDQYIQAKAFSNATAEDDGGRKGDAGSGVFQSQNIVDGNPQFVFNPETTGGKFAFNWEDFWATPFYYITQPDAAQLGPDAPNPSAIPWAEAAALGYKPMEGDTVPRRVLRAGAGSRADITAMGSKFIRETPDTVFGQDVLGVWSVQMQRLLETGHDDDVTLVPGKTYHIACEVHLWEYTTRDHYVSFPMSLSLGAGGDIAAVDLRAANATGSDTLPNWEDTAKFPAKRVYLFQPGISTWEFLSGKNAADGKVYTNPVTGLPVGQVHGGAGAVAAGLSCATCHNVRSADPAPAAASGPMEQLAGRRGGIWAATPVLQE